MHTPCKMTIVIANLGFNASGLFVAIDRVAAERTVQSFEDLAGLVIAHFADEEKIGLPEGHLQQHKDLLAVATDLLGKLKSGAATLDDATVDFLKNWLKNHIKSTDIPTYGK